MGAPDPPSYRELREQADRDPSLAARARLLEALLRAPFEFHERACVEEVASEVVREVGGSGAPLEVRKEWLRDYVVPTVLAYQDPERGAPELASAIAWACTIGPDEERRQLRDAVLDAGIVERVRDPDDRAALDIARKIGLARQDLLASLESVTCDLDRACVGGGRNRKLWVAYHLRLQLELIDDAALRAELSERTRAMISRSVGDVILSSLRPPEAFQLLEGLLEAVRQVEALEETDPRRTARVRTAATFMANMCSRVRTDEDHDRLAELLETAASWGDWAPMVPRCIAHLDVPAAAPRLLERAADASAMLLPMFLQELQHLRLPRQIDGWSQVSPEVIDRVVVRLSASSPKDTSLRAILGVSTGWIDELETTAEPAVPVLEPFCAAISPEALHPDIDTEGLRPWDRVAVADLCADWPDAEAVELLSRLVRSDERATRSAACAGLARRAPDRLVEVAREWAASDHEDDRAWAAGASRHFDARWPALIALETDPSPVVRATARGIDEERRLRAGSEKVMKRIHAWAREPDRDRAGEAYRAALLPILDADQRRRLLRWCSDPTIPPLGRSWLSRMSLRPRFGFYEAWDRWHGVIIESEAVLTTAAEPEPVIVQLCLREGRWWAATIRLVRRDRIFDGAPRMRPQRIVLRDPLRPRDATLVSDNDAIELVLADGTTGRLFASVGADSSVFRLDCSAVR